MQAFAHWGGGGPQGRGPRMEELENQLMEVAIMFPTPVLFAINQDISARTVHTVTAVFDVGGKVILPVTAKHLPVFFKLPVAGSGRPTLNALPANSRSGLIMVDITLDNKQITCLCDTEINLIPA